MLGLSDPGGPYWVAAIFQAVPEAGAEIPRLTPTVIIMPAPTVTT